jgi:hypothetical protein
MNDGAVGCTMLGCVSQCTYGGETYQIGESFPAGDGCNTCSCSESGVGCTAMACATECNYGGKIYQPGESFPAGDGCNTCTCSGSGEVACTLTDCMPVCIYAGQTYTPGQSFPALDGCNTCTCGEAGTIGCTEMACTCDPKKEWYREYVTTNPKTCELIDYSCPPNTTGFWNACGCGCEQSASCPEYFDCMPPEPCNPEALQLECPYSGIAY